jgi:hypothetical protein
MTLLSWFLKGCDGLLHTADCIVRVGGEDYNVHRTIMERAFTMWRAHDDGEGGVIVLDIKDIPCFSLEAWEMVLRIIYKVNQAAFGIPQEWYVTLPQVEVGGGAEFRLPRRVSAITINDGDVSISSHIALGIMSIHKQLGGVFDMTFLSRLRTNVNDNFGHEFPMSTHHSWVSGNDVPTSFSYASTSAFKKDIDMVKAIGWGRFHMNELRNPRRQDFTHTGIMAELEYRGSWDINIWGLCPWMRLANSKIEVLEDVADNGVPGVTGASKFASACLDVYRVDEGHTMFNVRGASGFKVYRRGDDIVVETPSAKHRSIKIVFGLGIALREIAFPLAETLNFSMKAMAEGNVDAWMHVFKKMDIPR